MALVNEAAARSFFGGGADQPIGQQIRFWGVSRTIVGVVANERFHGLAREAPPAVYLPTPQAPVVEGALLIRFGGDDPRALVPAVRAVVRDLDPALALFGVEPLAHTLSRTVAERRFAMLLLAGLAGVALLLAVVGVYGVLSYGVSQRGREIGIRMALGATGRAVTGAVLASGLRTAVAGVAVGLALAVLLAHALRGLLFGVGPLDPLVVGGTGALLTGVALLASWLPARRAARVEPGRALRGE